jgi:hypothetical protein
MMARGSMTLGPHLATLADSEGLPQGLLHWMMGVQGLYIYGGVLKRIIDPASIAPSATWTILTSLRTCCIVTLRW